MKITIEADSVAELRAVMVQLLAQRKFSKPGVGTSIDTLGLTVRTSNLLKSAGVYSVEDAATLSDLEFLRVPNAGRKSLNELREVLSRAQNGVTSAHEEL